MDRDRLIATLRQIKSLIDRTIEEIEQEGSKSKRLPVPRRGRRAKVAEISFSTNLLAFMKQHARGLSGDQKFTLLLARLVEGNTSQQVPVADLKKRWNRMKVVLRGRFNAAYANRAKANGWVDTPKHGVYTLSASWKEALNKANE